ncbi:oligosaccharide flippase family protein [Shewanella seohaensis]|uniref:oligosaccharide flippase family protein n=1 Tax=Shewanella seohaensis TaxID=755175 RepID=UPI0035B6CA15
MKAKSSFNKNVLTLFTGTFIAQGIPIAVSPILTRLYTPSDFGVFALYLSIVAIMAVLSTGRYELAVVLGKNDKNAIALVLGTILLSFICCIFFIFIIFITKDIIISRLDIVIPPEILLLTPVGALFVSMFQIFNYYLNRKGEFKSMAMSKVNQSLVTVVVQLALSFLLKFNIGLIIGEVIGRFVGTISQIKYFWGDFKNNLCFLSPARIIAVMKLRKKHPLFLMPTAVVETASNNSLPILLSMAFGASTLGFYSLATRTLSVPTALLGSSIGQVFFNEFSSAKLNKRRALIIKVWIKLLVIGAIPFSILFFYGEILFSIVFGDAWIQAGTFASILSPMLLTMFISSPTSTCYIVLGLEKYLLYFGSATFIIRCIAILIGLYFESIFVSLYIMVVLEIVKIFIFNFIALNKIYLDGK